MEKLTPQRLGELLAKADANKTMLSGMRGGMFGGYGRDGVITYNAFCTRDHVMGIYAVESTREPRPSVKVRYKLIQTSTEESTTTNH